MHQGTLRLVVFANVNNLIGGRGQDIVRRPRQSLSYCNNTDFRTDADAMEILMTNMMRFGAANTTALAAGIWGTVRWNKEISVDPEGRLGIGWAMLTWDY